MHRSFKGKKAGLPAIHFLGQRPRHTSYPSLLCVSKAGATHARAGIRFNTYATGRVLRPRYAKVKGVLQIAERSGLAAVRAA